MDYIKGNFYNDKSLVTTTIKPFITKTTNTKTMTSKTLTSKTKTTNTKTTRTKTTRTKTITTNTLSTKTKTTNTLSTTSLEISKKIPYIMTKGTTTVKTTVDYNKTTVDSKTIDNSKTKHTVLIILCIFSIIAVFLLIITNFRKSNVNVRRDTIPPVNDENNTRTLENPTYNHNLENPIYESVKI